MIGTPHVHSEKSKYIIIVVAIILIWQFSFPHASAATIKEPSSLTIEISYFVPLAHEVVHLPINVDRPRPETKRSLTIPVTAYSSTPDQTSGNPFITASGTHVEDGMIAANFLPIGTRVRFPEYYGDKIFIVEDRMAARYWQKADIWMETRDEAKEWGVRYTTIEII